MILLVNISQIQKVLLALGLMLGLVLATALFWPSEALAGGGYYYGQPYGDYYDYGYDYGRDYDYYQTYRNDGYYGRNYPPRPVGYPIPTYRSGGPWHPGMVGYPIPTYRSPSRYYGHDSYDYYGGYGRDYGDCGYGYCSQSYYSSSYDYYDYRQPYYNYDNYRNCYGGRCSPVSVNVYCRGGKCG